MKKTPRNRHALALRAYALAFPEAREDFPWGERVVKVKDKVFVFLGRDDEDIGVTVKLPSSGLLALSLPFASPTGYGLGKSGWVTARFGPKEKPPLELLRKWIDESYCAVAPKALVKALDQAPARREPRRIRYRKRRG
jgi:predicted DNA-binding protein (MmcQ/YjbR family)